MKLELMQPKAEDLIRPFWYPDNSDAKTGFKVTLRYLDPAAMAELDKRVRVQLTTGGKSKDDSSPADIRKEIVNAVLLCAIQKCSGVTFAKLAPLVPIGADAVAAAGGVDVAVPMDPTTNDEGRENLLFLINKCETFANWAVSICQNIARFQDADWEERVKNSSSGQRSNTDPTPSSEAQKA